MLRWAGGVTLLDKVQNKHIRGSMKVTSIEGKIKEARMRWYGHVMRRDDEKSTLHPRKSKRKRKTTPYSLKSNCGKRHEGAKPRRSDCPGQNILETYG